MVKKDIKAYKFLIKGLPNEYYPYENFDGLSLSEIEEVCNFSPIELLGVIDRTPITDKTDSFYKNFRVVWSKKISLNDSEQSINEKIVSEPEDNKYYNCFINRYCQEEQNAKVKEKKQKETVSQYY